MQIKNKSKNVCRYKNFSLLLHQPNIQESKSRFILDSELESKKFSTVEKNVAYGQIGISTKFYKTRPNTLN